MKLFQDNVYSHLWQWVPSVCVDWARNINNTCIYISSTMNQFSSVAQSCTTICTPWITACQPFLSITNSQSSLKLMPIKSVMPPAISSSVIPFSSCPQSFPASRSFPMSQLFAWGGQSIGVSALASVRPMNTQDWSLGLTDWISLQSTSVQSLSCVRLFVTPWTAACQASLSIINSWNLLKLMSTESVMPSNHLILCCSLLLPPSIFPSIRVFSNESALLIRWPKYWSFSFNMSLSNEYSRLISFRMDWLDLLAVQGTRKSLLQHHSSKASVLQPSVFFTVQLSHLWKNHSLDYTDICWQSNISAF